MLWEESHLSKTLMATSFLRSPSVPFLILSHTCCFSVTEELWRRQFSQSTQSMNFSCINFHPKTSRQPHSAGIAWNDLFYFLFWWEEGGERERERMEVGRKESREKECRKGRSVSLRRNHKYSDEQFKIWIQWEKAINRSAVPSLRCDIPFGT